MEDRGKVIIPKHERKYQTRTLLVVAIIRFTSKSSKFLPNDYPMKEFGRKSNHDESPPNGNLLSG